LTKLATVYDVGLQTICDVKNNKTNLMKFARNCSSGAGPF